MTRWIIVTLAAAIIAALVFFGLTRPQPVDTAEVRRGSISEYVEERATTRLPRTIEITMPIDGRVQPIELREGDPVEAGQIVAQIELADLDTAVAIAEARVRRLEARIVESNDTRLEESTLVELASVLDSIARSVEASRAETEASRAREEFRGADLERKQEAFADKAATLTELEEAELEFLESRVRYRMDVLTLRAIEAVQKAAEIWPLQVRQVIERKGLTEAVLAQELAEAKSSLAQSERDRDRALIRTPVDGVVLGRVESSQRVLPAGSLLLEIGRLEDLEVEVEVLSEEAVEMEVGDRVEITVPTVKHEPLVGSVSRIEPRGFKKISSLGVEQQRVLVIVRFEPSSLAAFHADGYAMGVGYRLRVRILTETRDDAVVIPRSALFRGTDDRWQTFAVRGGRAELVDLTLGLTNDTEAEVLAGLEAGEAVILAPESALEEGTRVEAR